ncbi:Type I secretion system membrane fusion protein PrsE [Thalassocella blandensis]|nr:Type I secretion system membrane fusion protein PrsE [Thalassocella blandensis]
MKHLKEKWEGAQSDHKLGLARSKYLVEAIVLEESNAVYQLKTVMIAVSVLVFGLIVWSYLTEMPELAIANGEVVPQGRIHKVQPSEGGILQDIHVKNGYRVKVGDPLITLDPTLINAEIETLYSSKIDLELRMERLDALILSRDASFVVEDNKYTLLADNQRNLYLKQLDHDKEKLNSIHSRRNHRMVEYKSKESQKNALKEEVSAYRQQKQMRDSLFSNGKVAKMDMLDTSARLASAKNRLAEVEGDLERIGNNVRELEQEAVEYNASRMEALNSERSDIARQLMITNEQLNELVSRRNRLVIRSNINGIVKGLNLNTVTGVVAAGELLLEIVPVEDELLVEAKLTPEDIGHVEKGQPVEVKVSSFEFQKFGTIPGKVKNVSASTYLEADNTTYYLTEISLDQNFVGEREGINTILPGMVVQVDIKTGKKSIMEYLLKPIQRGINGAFAER